MPICHIPHRRRRCAAASVVARSSRTLVPGLRGAGAFLRACCCSLLPAMAAAQCSLLTDPCCFGLFFAASQPAARPTPTYSGGGDFCFLRAKETPSSSLSSLLLP
ncbi:uncharacterized protein K452DRAFT_155361 [Aplosporella prunicola CBS 121167]|uniref:Uncharacterized protein n=1 Tax=Aplosporella prunicola CBS 121167 TaxID=1176127 RepID=A0A6A6BKQ1_9PEZI|nr:uncharacterized protein K452DRAFT_155361 [Aplosporella prunicola CBS 121167]KAF2144248.1 hypothetical protein K452DRAFT_155361 [Aplosporella prunicola CBS 121167]